MNSSHFVVDNFAVALNWLDYGFFIAMLLLSILIGLYFGLCGKQNNASEYLQGSKQMTCVPIGISLVASNISGITLLGVPTDVYRFGMTYYLYALMLISVCIITYYVYLPVFYKLQLVSSYEYLMLRFDRKIRLLSSGLYTINTLLYLLIVVYIPALALAQATGLSIQMLTPIICGVCILYTTIGGLKAVVWTDTLQFFVMMGSLIGVCYKGIESFGGIKEILIRAKDGKRLDFDFDIDPTKRDTVFATSIGTMFLGFAYISINQSFVQKFLSLPSKNEVKKALIIFYFGMLAVLTFVIAIGLIMYAHYQHCDPFTAGKIAKHDQILPFYVMEVATIIPGLTGLFLSGIFSAALSTLSAWMNCLAASVYEDFIKPYISHDTNEKRISNILKLLVCVIGTISTAMVFAVEHMGSIVPINFSISSITNGPLLGLFSLGMLFPVANAKGALYGSLVSMSIMTFIIIGSQINQFTGTMEYEPKPVSIEGCKKGILFNRTNPNYSHSEDVFVLFRITYYYYNFLGALLTIIVGVIVSYFTRTVSDPPVNPDLISPVAKWIANKSCYDERGRYLEVNMTEIRNDSKLEK